MVKANQKVITKCYNKEEVWNNRQTAIKFFISCIENSEGSERERYTNVLMDLLANKNYCTDMEV